MTRRDPCPNLNHSRMNVPVRCCPLYGEPVNVNIPAAKCSEEEHVRM